MLVYRGMDIGTAKPTPEERAGRPSPGRPGRAGRGVLGGEEFRPGPGRDRRRARPGAGAAAGGRVGLCTPWSTRTVFPRPTRPSGPGGGRGGQGRPARAVRPAGAADPAAAARISRQLRRTVRALEVMELTGLTLLVVPGGHGQIRLPLPPERGRPRPGRRAARPGWPSRVKAMAKAGLVDEVRRLAERPLSRTARQALGYKELLDAMEGHAAGEGAGGGGPPDPGLRPPPAGLVPPGPAGAMEYPSSGRSASPGPWRRWGRIDGGVRQGARDRQRLRGRGGPGRPLPDHPELVQAVCDRHFEVPGRTA